MHIHELRIQNFKRIEAATIPMPGSGAVEICGRNGQGKSSAIDAIWAALGGSKASPDKPVRHGSRRAAVDLDLGEFRVSREWDGRTTRLTVTDAEGCRMGRPQELLDGLFHRLAFDPMEFTRQAPAKQAETLRNVAGLDFTALDRERAKRFEERTDVNRAIKQQEALVADLPEVEPTEEVSAVDLLAQIQNANQRNAEVARARAAVERKDAEIDRLTTECRRLAEQLDQVRGQLDAAIDERFDLEAGVDDEFDVSELAERLSQVEAINRRARQYSDRQAALEILRGNRAHSEDLTLAIEEIDRRRLEMLASAKWPVPGLSVDGDQITVNGVPFSQVSTAEQIRVSLAMSAALNPKLKVVIIKEGSLLDESSLGLVAEWADANGYQVIVERVADSPNGVGVVIEEGRVVDAPCDLSKEVGLT